MKNKLHHNEVLQYNSRTPIDSNFVLIIKYFIFIFTLTIKGFTTLINIMDRHGKTRSNYYSQFTICLTLNIVAEVVVEVVEVVVFFF